MDDLSGLEAKFQERLKSYFATLQVRYEDYMAEDHMAVKESGFNWAELTLPEAAPLDDPWFWPDDQRPMPREKPSQLEPFWR